MQFFIPLFYYKTVNDVLGHSVNYVTILNNGNPERDRDYNHPGNMPFSHDHGWENGKRGKDHLPPDPSYKINWKPAIGVGLVVICVVCIIVVSADDATGVGIADDFLFGPLGAGVGKGLIMILG